MICSDTRRLDQTHSSNLTPCVVAAVNAATADPVSAMMRDPNTFASGQPAHPKRKPTTQEPEYRRQMSKVARICFATSDDDEEEDSE